jgi:hypothetical protein
MSDPVWPIETKDLPLLGTVMGIGEALYRNTSPDATGRYFATSWFTLLLPIVPLGRYYVSQGETQTEYTPIVGSKVSTEYRFYGRSRLRLVEIVRTFLYCWGLAAGLFGPLVILIMGPNVFPPFRDMTEMFVAGGLLVVVLLAGRAIWTPVRAARFVPSRAASRRPRR